MKRILFAASECVPFIKTGGLADVCGALPKEFSKEEWDVRVVIPNYSCIPEKYRSQFQYVTHFYMSAGSYIQNKYVGVLKYELDGITYYFIDNEETIKKKVMSALTDTNKIKKDDPANPDVCMVYYYHNLVNKEENTKKICEECKMGSRGCVQCKKELIEAMNNFLKPIQERRKKYDDNKELVDEILNKGTEKAREKAKEVMQEVKHAMKIDY